MRKYLIHIGCFLLLMLTINVGLYFFVASLYEGDYSKYDSSYHSYLFADSHGLPLRQSMENYGIYNFSAGSDSYLDIFRKITFLSANFRVDTVIVSVDNHMLSPYRFEVNNADRSATYLTETASGDFYDFIKTRYLIPYIVMLQPKSQILIKYYLVSKINKIMSRSKISAAAENTVNWFEMSKTHQMQLAGDRIRNQFPSAAVSTELTETLKKIINYCKGKNIVLIGIKFPVASAYLDMLQQRDYGASELFESYGITILDFQKEFIQEDRYFDNQDHLNPEGGKKLAVAIAAELDRKTK